MFKTFCEQVRDEAGKIGLTLREISYDMGYSKVTLSVAICRKNFSPELMTCIADYFQKDIIYHNGEFEMIERKERNGYC